MSPWCLCLVPGCTLWLLPGALPSENTLFFGCVRNSGFLVVTKNVYRPVYGRNPGSSLVHTHLCCNNPYVGRRDCARSHHVVFCYTYLRASVGSGLRSGIALLPVPDRDDGLCAALVPFVG